MTKLRKSDLKKHLIRSVQMLRVSLDYTAYCYFILAMLFSYHTDITAFRSTRIPQISRVPLPQTSQTTGNFYRRRKKDVKGELTETFTTIEKQFPQLKGVLLPSIVNVALSDEELSVFQEHIDELDQQTDIFFGSEQFSQAYEYWIEQFANMTLKRGISFYTPRPLVRMMVEMVKPCAGMSIYDPTAGTGGMLISAANRIRQHGGDLDSTYFYGREQSSTIWAICKMNVQVHQIENASIEQGNSLNETSNQADTFDIVLQNLPLATDPENRGQTRRMYAAFLRHTIESLAPNGRAAILAPALVLQQNHQEIWRSVLGRDWLEAVITLPSNLLHGSHGAASVLIFNKKKIAERRMQVLFIRFESPVQSRSHHLQLTDTDLMPVIQAFESWDGASDYSRVVPVSQIEAYNYNLNIEHYPDWNAEPESFNITTLLNRYQTAIQKRESAVQQLIKSLEALHHVQGASSDKER